MMNKTYFVFLVLQRYDTKGLVSNRYYLSPHKVCLWVVFTFTASGEYSYSCVLSVCEIGLTSALLCVFQPPS